MHNWPFGEIGGLGDFRELGGLRGLGGLGVAGQFKIQHSTFNIRLCHRRRSGRGGRCRGSAGGGFPLPWCRGAA